MENKIPDEFPIIHLSIDPPVASPGDQVEVELRVDKKIPEGIQLDLKLLSVNSGAVVYSTTIDNGKKKKFAVPKDLMEGDYEFNLNFKDYILDSVPFEVANKEVAKQAALFLKELKGKEKI